MDKNTELEVNSPNLTVNSYFLKLNERLIYKLSYNEFRYIATN